MSDIAIFMMLCIACMCVRPAWTQFSLPNFYNCNNIKVSGAKLLKFNGVYKKIFECNLRATYEYEDKTTSDRMYLFFRNTEHRWAIGRPDLLGGCGVITQKFSIIGAGNKLYPHMVESIWEESGSTTGFVPNTDLAVECYDMFWTMGCSGVNFPLSPQLLSRCPNATSAIDVKNVYVINYPAGKERKCADEEKLCIVLGNCGLEELECRARLGPDDYEYKLVHSNCDGRHHQCHPFQVRPFFHIKCDINVVFPCNENPDVRDGVLIEYKCKQSRRYKGPTEEAEEIDNPPIQTRTTCTTTPNPLSTTTVEDSTDDTLIKYVAPGAGAVFLVIIIAVIVVTLKRRQNQRKYRENNRPTAVSDGVFMDNTYENITSQGEVQPQKKFKRPDITEKKKSEKPSSDISSVLDAVVQSVVDGNPSLQGAQEGKGNGMYVVILDQNGEIVEGPNSTPRSVRAGTNSVLGRPGSHLIPRAHTGTPKSRSPQTSGRPRYDYPSRDGIPNGSVMSRDGPMDGRMINRSGPGGPPSGSIVSRDGSERPASHGDVMRDGSSGSDRGVPGGPPSRPRKDGSPHKNRQSVTRSRTNDPAYDILQVVPSDAGRSTSSNASSRSARPPMEPQKQFIGPPRPPKTGTHASRASHHYIDPIATNKSGKVKHHPSSVRSTSTAHTSQGQGQLPHPSVSRGAQGHSNAGFDSQD